MTTTKPQQRRRQIPARVIWLAVAVVLFLLPLFVEFDGLSPAGHRMFAIFLVAIVLWVAEPIPLFGTAALIILLEVVMISDKAIVDLPADFTDASLLALGERLQCSDIISTDRKDFAVYRPRHVERMVNLLEPVER